MSAQDDIRELIRVGREGLGTEFKASMSWGDPVTQGKVVKAALALANKRDGGTIVFGLVQPGGKPLHEFVGMKPADYNSFSQDAVSSLVNGHASPHVDLTVEHSDIDGQLLVAIVVREFTDYPVVCSKDFVANGKPVVIRGRLYCRSRRMPESTEVQSPEDMRDIIELSTAKGLERYFRLRDIERRTASLDDAGQFKKQLGDLGK